MKEKPYQIVELADLGGDGWLYPIWNALNRAETEGRIPKCSEKFLQGIRSVAMALNTRRGRLSIVFQELKEAFEILETEVSEEGHPEKPGYAIIVGRKFIDVFGLRVESVLSLWKSANESLDAFLKKFLQHINVFSEPKEYMKGLCGLGWIDFVREHRNFALHSHPVWPKVMFRNGKVVDFVLGPKTEQFCLGELLKYLDIYIRDLNQLQAKLVHEINSIQPRKRGALV